jgi:hypothetical protein
MSGYNAVYAGHLTPAGVNVHTYTDAELGAGWSISDELMEEFKLKNISLPLASILFFVIKNPVISSSGIFNSMEQIDLM